MANINNLANEIARELQRYANAVEDDLEVAKLQTSDELVADLKETSPKRTGKYKKSWTKIKEGNRYIIHNSKHYRLTHLLEKGHAKVGGGRVPARVHIRPAEEKAIDQYVQKVERAIQQ